MPDFGHLWLFCTFVILSRISVVILYLAFIVWGHLSKFVVISSVFFGNFLCLCAGALSLVSDFCAHFTDHFLFYVSVWLLYPLLWLFVDTLCTRLWSFCGNHFLSVFKRHFCGQVSLFGHFINTCDCFEPLFSSFVFTLDILKSLCIRFCL